MCMGECGWLEGVGGREGVNGLLQPPLLLLLIVVTLVVPAPPPWQRAYRVPR